MGRRTKARSVRLCLAATLLLTFSATAQTLAHRNWSGNGLTSTAWWQDAVFYRITPAAFQDSDGDGIGDLPGIAQRADYLQALGIDALVLAPPDDPDAFSTLQRELSAHHIRLVVELSPSPDLLSAARLWLSRGAAGICVAGDASAQIRELLALIRSFPGERVLIAASDVANQTGLPAQAIGAQLVLQPAGSSPAAERTSLPSGSLALFEVVPPTRADAGQRKILAARLLARPGAAVIRWGDELGLSTTSQTVMQWTPGNVTPPHVNAEPPSSVAAIPADPNAYTAFKPYVPPKPQPKPLPAGSPLPPDSLPGFTTGKLPNPPAGDAASVNVAVEDADPLSLLNFYRRLSQLHHGHPALRSGTEVDFDHAAEKAVVWLRRAPSGTRHTADILVLCNLGDQPLTLSMDADLLRLHIRAGSMRPLLASWSAHPPFQYTSHVTLPPHGVYLGEISR